MTAVEPGVAGGISFALTSEQRELRALAREFADKEIRPMAAEYDEHQTHPADLIEKAHELGLMNVHVPEDVGGPGLPAFEGMLIGEELSWGCAGIAVSIVANTLGAAPVMIAGSDEQKRTWLPPLLEAPLLCSFALSEPDAGSDAARIKTVAERRVDEYVLNGSKMFITNAGHAAWSVVFASTDRSKGHKGLSAFVVPMDVEGVSIAMHQGVNFLIADMATEIEAARLLTWQAAWMLDSGYGRKATLYSSFAKRFSADTAMKVTTDAVQVFGGYGYIKEYPVEKLMRDAKLFQIYEGTSQIQRLVIAKEIFLPSQ